MRKGCPSTIVSVSYANRPNPSSTDAPVSADNERTPAPCLAQQVWDQRLLDLYQTERTALIRLAMRLVDRRELAEEVVHDAFVRYHTTTHRPAEGKEAQYLRSIVMNNARSLLRRRQVSEAWRPELPHTAPTTETEWLRYVERSAVTEALDTLPERQREVMVLRHIAGFSETETATKLRISVGAVKTHGSRARTALRAHLGVAHAA